MYRTFHSKVGWWYWLLMGVTAFLLLDFFWFHHTVLMILTAVAMVFEIEMLIHTCYILTEDGEATDRKRAFCSGHRNRNPFDNRHEAGEVVLPRSGIVRGAD